MIRKEAKENPVIKKPCSDCSEQGVKILILLIGSCNELRIAYNK